MITYFKSGCSVYIRTKSKWIIIFHTWLKSSYYGCCVYKNTENKENNTSWSKLQPIAKHNLA